MNQGIYEITHNNKLAEGVYEMGLSGDTSQITRPGQFINIKIDGFFLRRPISVCDWDDSSITIIYKTVGGGTEAMSKMSAGDKLDVLCGLGNGFDTEKSGDSPLLIGGGVGIPPMYGLCKRLMAEGKNVTVILGFNKAAELFYVKEFKDLGAKVLVTTADGSYGMRGFATTAMRYVDYSYFYTCGPMPMFLAIEKEAVTSGQYSFEDVKYY